ncbi:MAG: beta-galactosidase [Armatimonadota bacterium]|nr:beta-galactosidase [Armatimonadota bacterium]
MFTCDADGFKLNGKPFTPTGAAYALVTDVNLATNYDIAVVEKDLDICKDLGINVIFLCEDEKRFEPEDDKWNDTYVANYDDFIERAHERGIYITAGTLNYAATQDFNKLPQDRLKALSDTRFLSELILRERAKWTREFLKRLRNRDKLFAWVIYTEPATNAWADEDAAGPGFMGRYMRSDAMRRWHDYLRKRYGTFEEVCRSWSLDSRIEAMRPEEVDFDSVRPAFEGDIHYYTEFAYARSWRRSEDYQRFLAEDYVRSANHLCREVKSIAPDLLVCNSLLPVLLPVLRSHKWAAAVSHHGIAYPDRLVEPRLETDFTAIRFSPDMDAWSESLSGPAVPIEYKLNIGLPAAVAYMRKALEDVGKPLMFFDLDNADFGDWTDEMMREHTAIELPLALFAGARGYLWWCYKTGKEISPKPYGLVDDNRRPTSRYNVAKDFNRWARRRQIAPAPAEVTVLINETDALVAPWDTWASLEAISASLLSRGVGFEVMTVREFVEGRRTKGKVIWLRNGFADIHPSHPALKRLMSDPRKRALVIGVDRFLSTQCDKAPGSVLEASMSVLADLLTVVDKPFRPDGDIAPVGNSPLKPVSKPAFIEGKYGMLTGSGREVAPGVGYVVAEASPLPDGPLFAEMTDAQGRAVLIGHKKQPYKRLLLLQPHAIWYGYQQPGALDLIPDCLGISRKSSPGVFGLSSKSGAFSFRAFGSDGPSVEGLTFDESGRLVRSGKELGEGEVRMSYPSR